MKPAVLLVCRLPEALGSRLRERFDCHELAQLDSAGLEALAPRLRGMVASGESVVGRELITRLPALEIISVLGVGYDGIDIGDRVHIAADGEAADYLVQPDGSLKPVR